MHESGTQIKQARRLAEMTQVDLAAAAGVSQQLVSMVEHGYRPGERARDSIAGALRTPAAKLFGGES